MSRRFWVTLLALTLVLPGCSLFPEVKHQATMHNPFPQLSRIAVAPFFNMSDESTVDGRQFALGYYNELQLIPGFEVVPLAVVEQELLRQKNDLSGPEDARRLAEALEVDVVVIGAVTDFTPYYPPRCGLQVEWHAANPGFHPIPPGYGLPWGTPAEEEIPPALIFEAEMALAREQLATQTPEYDAEATNPTRTSESSSTPPEDISALTDDSMPPGWPDSRGFVPRPPSGVRPSLQPTDQPVMRHTRIYNGHDADFTSALAEHCEFRDDARFGGWQNYLQRSDDFIRFCCRMHIWEMLGARGGAGESRVAWRWSAVR